MTKIPCSVTLLLVIALPAWAQNLDDKERSDQWLDQQIVISDELLYSLPTDVADGVIELLAYGDRYEKAIKQIVAEAARPGLGWEGQCDHSPPGATHTPGA